MYSVISKGGVYYSDSFGGAVYPQCLEIFREEAERYAERCKEKWPVYDFKVIEVEIKAS